MSSAVRFRFRLGAALAAAGAVALAVTTGIGPATAQIAEVRAGSSLASFQSDAELREFLMRRAQQERLREPPPPPPPPPPPAAPPPAGAEAAAPVSVTAQAASPGDSITNTQEAGVDEGGIVKKRGDLLVVLRRGRLFTVSTAGGAMRPVDWIDAMPPGADASSDWYDEMLLYGDRVIVVGYSYGRGGTEINRFRISPDGRLRFEDAYHLRSNDYYSSRNYASRLIGDRLIYYTPLYLDWDEDPLQSLPAIRRWTGNHAGSGFRRVVSARNVFVVPRMRDDPEADIDTIHSVFDCDLTAPVLDCSATAVLGPASRNFYVSPEAVYLWVSDAWHTRVEARRGVRSFVYRIPFDRERPSAIAARGAPTDQFSFREDRANGLLDVLVRSDGGGDWMWNPESSEGEVALLSIPVRYFGNGSREVPLDRYRRLPPLRNYGWNFQNRFVGNHVLYGSGNMERQTPNALIAAMLRGGPVTEIPLPHAVERIDILGRDGVVIGGDPRGGLYFTTIELDPPLARRGNSFRMPDASQGESRSHGFFYRPHTPDGSNGLLGLPIARQVPPGFHRLFGSAASILFLERIDGRLGMAGELGADYRTAVEDNCVASCVDWYGNARPIFAGERIFALLGYELVEGRQVRDKGIREVGRITFAPTSLPLPQRR